MKRFFLPTLILTCTFIALLPACADKTGSTENSAENPVQLINVSSYYRKIMEAANSEDGSRYLHSAQELYDLCPAAPNAVFLYAVALYRNNDKEKCGRLLKDIAAMGACYRFENDSDLTEIAKDPAFTDIVSSIHANGNSLIGADIWYTHKANDLFPEGITADPVTGNIFTGSLLKRNIVTIDKDGISSDFIPPCQDGILKVLGLKIDSKNRILWACAAASAVPATEIAQDSIGMAGVFKYDSATGKLIKKYMIGNKPKTHLFNDLALHSNGNVYITDTEEGALYRIARKSDKLEKFLQLEFQLNGIAFSGDERKLYVAAFDRIYIVDTAAKTFTLLKHPEYISPAGTDGLSFYQNSLLAVQNENTFNRVARFFLNDTGDTITGIKILNSRFPAKMFGTTGTVAGNKYYVSCTEIWPPYNTGTPRQPVILSIDLD